MASAFLSALDPLNALASLIVQIIQARRVQQWWALIFQMAFSGTVSFLFTTGSLLIAQRSLLFSLGSGMVTASVVLAYFFRRSPLTKGMMAVLPQAEAQAELDQNLQTIERK